MLSILLFLSAAYNESSETIAAVAAATALVPSRGVKDGEVAIECKNKFENDKARPFEHYYGNTTDRSGSLLRDASDYGILNLFVPPSPVWIVDNERGVLRPTDGGANMTIEEVDEGMLHARSEGEGPSRHLIVDRMTGDATFIASADVSQWNAKFGVSLGSYEMWILKCRRLERVF